MRRARSLVIFIAFLAMVSFSSCSQDASVESLLLQLGSPLCEHDLQNAEGEIFSVGVVIGIAFGILTGGGVAAIYENWFDEDYGIDRDDLREIAFGAISGAITAGGGAAAVWFSR